MSVDHGKLYINTSIDNNMSDDRMLRYHDFELIPKYKSPSIAKLSQSTYKQAYQKYQTAAHNRQFSIPSTVKRNPSYS